MKALLSSPRSGFTAKGFPRPVFLPSAQPARHDTACAGEPDIGQKGPIVLRYTRNLVGITGVVTVPSMDYSGPLPEMMAPTGLGEAVDAYLNAHGYDANSRLHVMHAWRENDGLADFISDMCGKGMPMAEAEWLWCLLFHNN